MGYYTRYSISFIQSQTSESEKNAEIAEVENSNLSQKLKNQILQTIENEYESQRMTETLLIKELDYNPFEDSCKWYDHNKDMLRISKKYPGTIFVLNGDGEESGDVWRKYYHKGLSQDANARIVYDDFDVTKLS